MSALDGLAAERAAAAIESDAAGISLVARSAGVSAGIMAMAVTNILPALVGVLTDRLALGSGQAGLVASADVAGLTVGSVVCALLKSPPRPSGIGGLVVLALCNLATVFCASFPSLLAVRFAAGLGGGFALAVSYAVMGAAGNARDFSAFNLGQVAIGVVATMYAPELTAAFGWTGIFGIMAALSVGAAALGVFLPSRIVPGDDGARAAGDGSLSLTGLSSVVAVLIYFAAQGAVWAYLDRMGVIGGLGGDDVLVALSRAMLAAMSASLVTIWLGTRLGILTPLLAGFALTIAGSIAIGATATLPTYTLAVGIFLFGWQLLVPYQFLLVAKADRNGALVMLASTASVAGLALGPALAAPLADAADYGVIRGLDVLVLVLSLALLVPAARPARPSGA